MLFNKYTIENIYYIYILASHHRNYKQQQKKSTKRSRTNHLSKRFVVYAQLQLSTNIEIYFQRDVYKNFGEAAAQVQNYYKKFFQKNSIKKGFKLIQRQEGPLICHQQICVVCSFFSFGSHLLYFSLCCYLLYTVFAERRRMKKYVKTKEASTQAMYMVPSVKSMEKTYDDDVGR